MTHNFVSLVFHCTIQKTFRRWLCYFAVAGAALLSAHPAQAQNFSDPRLLRLLSLMQQRLNMAQDVARHKWSARISIDEPEPEEALLKKVAGLASQYGIEQRVAHDFFVHKSSPAK
ncbi:chorismate mutase [Undibacterium sp. Di27W]|uniref:chorismate mutase n=1 Tax=Undibacterium sp. Di27W TaxID=3413036 RepID=UPI003BF094E4